MPHEWWLVDTRRTPAHRTAGELFEDQIRGRYALLVSLRPGALYQKIRLHLILEIT